MDQAGVSKNETKRVKLVSISKESMGQVKDKELITWHRAQNTLAQLRIVARTVQVQWVPAHSRLWAGRAGGRASLSPCCLPVASGAPRNGRSRVSAAPDNRILARALGRSRRTRTLRPVWPKTSSDHATHNPAACTVAGIVPMEPSDLINCNFFFLI